MFALHTAKSAPFLWIAALLTLLTGLLLLGAVIRVPLTVHTALAASNQPRITVRGNRLYAGSQRWRAFGMNWGIGDHAPVIAYFDNPTSHNAGALEAELRVARLMGANSMRIYLQLGQVMATPSQPRQRTLIALKRVLELARRERIYLDITGNLVWQPSRSPAWYERMTWRQRWQVQARFWRAVAHAASSSPAVLCYELTSEPIVSQTGRYYFGQIGGWWFVQSIATAPARDAAGLARSWTRLLSSAVHAHDDRPVTIGMLPLTTGPFAPANVARYLDMLTVHEYPTSGQATAAVSLIRTFASYGKPVLLGETFPLSCDATSQHAFLTGARRYLAGTFAFFNGQDPRTMEVRTMSDAFYQAGLQQFLGLRGVLLGG